MDRRRRSSGERRHRQAQRHFRNPESASWEEAVRQNLRPGYVLAGVGNRSRGDDAVGSIIAERLAERGLANALDCGGAPENYLGRIRDLRPTGVLFVDAADFEEAPGTIRLFGLDSVPTQSISTHSAGLRLLMEFLSAGSTVTCWALAIQPARLTRGAGLSEPVRQAAEQIVSSNVWFESIRAPVGEAKTETKSRRGKQQKGE